MKSIYPSTNGSEMKPDVDTFIDWLLRHIDETTVENLHQQAMETLGSISALPNDLRPTLERFLAQAYQEEPFPNLN